MLLDNPPITDIEDGQFLVGGKNVDALSRENGPGFPKTV